MNIHMVWLGGDYDHLAVENIRSKNPNCNLMVWTDDRLLPSSWKKIYDNYAKPPQMKSDLLRLCALREYGGLYIDFDCKMTTDAYTITKYWTNFTIPALCYSILLPGNILYCPKSWKYWDYVDAYINNYNRERSSILAFTHCLYETLPPESYDIIHDCEKFPTSPRFVTQKSLIIRYNERLSGVNHNISVNSV